eukprot:jgi/Mesvir1/29696/Mv00930-RA.1
MLSIYDVLTVLVIHDLAGKKEEEELHVSLYAQSLVLDKYIGGATIDLCKLLGLPPTPPTSPETSSSSQDSHVTGRSRSVPSPQSIAGGSISFPARPAGVGGGTMGGGSEVAVTSPGGTGGSGDGGVGPDGVAPMTRKLDKIPVLEKDGIQKGTLALDIHFVPLVGAAPEPRLAGSRPGHAGPVPVTNLPAQTTHSVPGATGHPPLGPQGEAANETQAPAKPKLGHSVSLAMSMDAVPALPWQGPPTLSGAAGLA